MHEEQLGLIQQYTNISHIKTCLHYLEKGLHKCEKNFIEKASNKEDDSQSQSESSDEEQKAPQKFDLQAMLQKNLGKEADPGSSAKSVGYKIFEKFMK